MTISQLIDALSRARNDHGEVTLKTTSDFKDEDARSDIEGLAVSPELGIGLLVTKSTNRWDLNGPTFDGR